MALGSIIRRRLPRATVATSALSTDAATAEAPPTNCRNTWEPRKQGEEKLPLVDPPLTPRDEAIALLHATAEIEHTLMVEYLYAAYSLGEVAADDPNLATKKPKVDLIRFLMLHIAREEMAHLATMENLLHLLGGALHFSREQSPFSSMLLPFRFKLEPMSLGSLAKYVIAESPRPLPTDVLSEADRNRIMGEVTDQAKASNDGICPGHVGDIFARLLWLFGKVENESDDDKKSRLADEDFVPRTEGFQAAWDDFGFDPKNRNQFQFKGEPSLVRQFAGTDPAALRSEAHQALAAIAEQGEGIDDDTTPAGEGESHFEWFWRIYEAFHDLTLTPGGAPVHNVPINPNTSPKPTRAAPHHKMVDAGLEAAVEAGRITHPRSLLWAQLFNLRYRMLLGQLHHYLRLDTPRYDAVGDRTARGLLLIGVFHEMRRLKKIAGKLVQLPKSETDGDPHRAGPPFELPYTTQLPDGEARRWRGHLDVSRALSHLVDEMLEDTIDGADGFLQDLRAADLADQTVMAELVAGRAPPQPPQDFPKVVQILEEAVRGFTIGGPHRNFWAEKELADFKAEQGVWVDPGNADSRIINVLAGVDADVSGYMPRERPMVPDERQEYIKRWVTANPPCPDSNPPYAGLKREREPNAEVPAVTPAPPVTPAPVVVPTFNAQIQPLFTPNDVSCMQAFGGFDLSVYADVKANAPGIFQRLDSGNMPPTGRWPQADIDLFKAWMEAGFPES